MSKQGEIRRYSLIIEKIRHGQFPTFPEIKTFCMIMDSRWETGQYNVILNRFDLNSALRFNTTGIDGDIVSITKTV